MTPDERIAEAVAGFQKLAVPPRPDWAPPQRVAVASRVHPHRRLVMKLGIGSLAAMVAIGAGLMLAAAPAVTLAQAAEAVRAKKLVRYKWEQVVRPEYKGPSGVGAVIYTCEDLTGLRRAAAECVGATRKDRIVIDGVAKRFLIVNRVTRDEGDAFGSGPPVDKEDGKPMAHFGVIPKAKLAEALAKPGWMTRLSKVVVVGEDADWPKAPLEPEFARPPLLDRIKALAESKASATTREPLDGKPAVKIVGTEDKREITVWLDPATKLPLRIERPHLFSPDKLITVESGFEWDFALPAGLTLEALFSTEPPPGVALTLVVE